MHCRFCGHEGHNRNSCPKVKEYAVKAKELIAQGEDRFSLNWEYRYSLSVDEMKQNRKANAVNNPRKCSYCNNSGHNRSSCGILKDDKQSVRNLEYRYRLCVKAWLPNSGLGMGAIGNTNVNRTYHNFAFMITKMNIESFTLQTPIGYRAAIGGIYLNREHYEGDEMECGIIGGTNFFVNMSQTNNNNLYMLASPAAIPFEIPNDYLTTGIDKYIEILFEEKPKRRNRWRSDTEHVGVFNSNRPNIPEMTSIVESYEANIASVT